MKVNLIEKRWFKKLLIIFIFYFSFISFSSANDNKVYFPGALLYQPVIILEQQVPSARVLAAYLEIVKITTQTYLEDIQFKKQDNGFIFSRKLPKLLAIH